MWNSYIDLSANGASFSKFVRMPSERNGHGMCVLDAGRKVFVTGGDEQKSWMLDITARKRLLYAPLFPHRQEVMCGVARRHDGTEVVVAAGGVAYPNAADVSAMDNVNVFNPATGSWNKGKSISRWKSRGGSKNAVANSDTLKGPKHYFG